MANTNKIKIKLKSYEKSLLETWSKRIVDSAKQNGLAVAGPIPIPVKKSTYCVIRSPHKHKDSREIFETRVHKRLIEVTNPSPELIDSLMRLDLPRELTVKVQVK
ncbi:MAG: 30S ribosomal protein S10 [Bifidobacteriaceae bacterium]|jgi:small subunit ribosomal protein S10|nr:30S ribosomal protein S10 [Bifidobacteriaceae bacterium]